MKIPFFALIIMFPICLISQNNLDSVKVLGPFSIDSWTVLDGKDKNNPIIIRLNNGFLNFEEKKKYPFTVLITLKLKQADNNGLPTYVENFNLYSVEDTLYHYLVTPKLALPVLVITTNGKREYVFYSKDKKLIESNALLKKSKIKSYDLEYYFKNDKEWSLFYKYDNLIK